jgi:hypothetical protein
MFIDRPRLLFGGLQVLAGHLSLGSLVALVALLANLDGGLAPIRTEVPSEGVEMQKAV